MEWVITVVVAVIGCIISILTYFAGQKKNSNADVEKSAFFQGEITAKLDQKLTRNTGELHEEIDKKILDHERRYHNAGHN